MFWKKTFYDEYGNFDNSAFLHLLEKAKKGKRNNINWKHKKDALQINLFNSVSKKE